ASASESSVLPVPGTPSSSTCPPARSEVTASIFTRSWPRITVSRRSRSAAKREAMSGMVCMLPSDCDRCECFVEFRELLGERVAADLHPAGQLRDALLQLLAAQSRRGGDGARQRLAIEHERLAIGHRAVVQRAERAHEIDGFGACLAVVVLRLADALAVAPERRRSDGQQQQEERP